MWFIVLVAVCAIAIPISMEIHAKGSDNILSRCGNELMKMAGSHELAGNFGTVWSGLVTIIAFIALLALAGLVGMFLLKVF
jgi:hypothetical protein